MGMIDRFLNMAPTVTAVSNAATGVAEVFTPNSTRRMELDEEAFAVAMSQLQAEFGRVPGGWFDELMNGLNRLPRPLLTLGTIGLFVYSMVEPVGFSQRMQGLALVPEPLWWLMGAIVSFYFGAREAHYFRGRVWPRARVSTAVAAAPADDGGWRAPAPPPLAEAGAAVTPAGVPATPAPDPDDDLSDNAALRDWRAAMPAP
ncbi:holin family protein [Paracoccus luteus]|uniref:holin family protein n=1 Tax=Paracoccus luteus TaxID=2508543 RepID=UPI00106FCF94|nr:holin family protein [Paracoccus luteus]